MHNADSIDGQSERMNENLDWEGGRRRVYRWAACPAREHLTMEYTQHNGVQW